MKKILSSLFVIFFTIISYSQSLIVTGDSIVYGHPSVFQLEASLSVKNISSNTAVAFCEKNVIQQNQAGTSDFCWAGQCYDSTTFVSTKTDTISPGGESDGFTGHYQPWNVADVAMVEYCFYLESDPNDRTCATITYNATGLISSNKVSISEKIGSFYPNPTSQYINFQFNVNINSTLQITDVLGNTVKIVDLNGAGEMSIYLGELHEGVYFANLIQDSKIIKIKKIIINK